MIAIDFQGGQHGNFLEFVCNKFLAGVACGDSPFNEHGASHIKRYTTSKIFHCGHYFMQNPVMPKATERVVSIQMDTDDLLPLSAISLLRAGDYGYDNDQIEVDTYHKFNNKDYRCTLDTLVDSFFTNRFKEAYYACKDPSWPDIADNHDFDILPDAIKEECRTQHGVEPLYLDQNHPHCPRHILREFFKIGFLYPEGSGFLSQQKEKMIYDEKYLVQNFEFRSFYNTPHFLDQIDAIAHFTQMPVHDREGLIILHREFLQRQPYKNLKITSDDIYQQVIDGKFVVFQNVNLLQESYLDARFEKIYGRPAPTNNLRWFKDSVQVRQYFTGAR